MSGGPACAPLPAAADVVVVGAGLMGSATARAAVGRGLSTVLLEQFEAGHVRGSSHGSARIVRRAYVDPFYARLSGEALERWRELEDDAQARLVRMSGGLDHGARRDVPALSATLAALGVEHEVLPPGEAERRWPGMTFSGPVLHHPQAGTVDAAAAVAASVRRAGDLGAHVAHATPVTFLRVERDGGARVVTGRGEVRARRVVVAAGAWLEPLLAGSPVEVPLPALEVTQQQVFHFARRPGVPEWPVAIEKGALSLYSLPGGDDGGPGGARKVAEYLASPPGTRPTTAQERDGVVDPAARERVVDHVRRWLPGLVPDPFAEATCLYTSTATEDFVLDRVGPLVVCSPCSGHGAKFAPLIGQRAVDLVLGSAPEPRFTLAAQAARPRAAGPGPAAGRRGR